MSEYEETAAGLEAEAREHAEAVAMDDDAAGSAAAEDIGYDQAHSSARETDVSAESYRQYPRGPRR